MVASKPAFRVLLDFLRLVLMTCRSRSAVEAENLFLRKQLALFQERKNKTCRADDSVCVCSPSRRWSWRWWKVSHNGVSYDKTITDRTRGFLKPSPAAMLSEFRSSRDKTMIRPGARR
jgi:hypothetical protein